MDDPEGPGRCSSAPVQFSLTISSEERGGTKALLQPPQSSSGELGLKPRASRTTGHVPYQVSHFLALRVPFIIPLPVTLQLVMPAHVVTMEPARASGFKTSSAQSLQSPGHTFYTFLAPEMMTGFKFPVTGFHYVLFMLCDRWH